MRLSGRTAGISRMIANELLISKLLREQSALAQQIYDIREKLRMTREDLAEFSGLAPEIIEDLEESDHDGDWDEAIE